MKKQIFLPWIIPEQCEGCTECVTQCPVGCLFMKETSIPEVYVPWMEKIDHCTGCGKCQDSCVWMAISLTSFVNEAHKRFLHKEI